MSARFGLRITRRLRRVRDRGAFWKDMRALTARLRKAPGSQAVHTSREPRSTKKDQPKRRRLRAFKPAPVDQLARLRRIVTAMAEAVKYRGRNRITVPKKIRRAMACLEAGVPNTGRQWRKLRKQRPKAAR